MGTTIMLGTRNGLLIAAVLLGGCATTEPITVVPVHPDVAPGDETAGHKALLLDASVVQPMEQEVFAIDLAATVQVAAAENIDIRQARLEVEASRGRYDSTKGRAFPALAPTALFEVTDGKVRATEGNILDVGFHTFRSFLAVDWLLNPGRIYYEIVAAKKRLAATEHQERAVVLATLRDAVIQFYDLVLAQSRVATAHQALDEARELRRINELRLRAGTGVPADTLRAEAHLAEREQDLTSAMNGFYQASVALAITLRLDPTVTLIPNLEVLPTMTLVREELGVEDLLAMAAQFRPDLASIRKVAEAVGADRGAAWWGGFGPTFHGTYQVGGITGHTDAPSSLEHDSSFDLQQRFIGGVGFRLSPSVFGDLRAAKAIEEQTLLEAERMLDRVRGQVVSARQRSLANAALIDKAKRQVEAAEEALRLTQANLQSGTMTTIDVLAAEDAAARARLRYAGAVVGYNKSQVQLLAAIGLLDAESLTPPPASSA